ncbi:MAG: tol-pal system protein YbgF [Rhodobacteraceae bacterium]|nr:tol-pal system protein YbgF [Paracoccaceae bacterium]
MVLLTRLRRLIAAFALTTFAIVPAQAQEAGQVTLADLRLQLLDLYGQMEALRRELTPSLTRPESQLSSGNSTLRRLDELEWELRDTISKVEDLEFRILRIAADGNRQIRDLEFMLAELSGQDLSLLEMGQPLGEELPSTVSNIAEDAEPAEVADLSELEKDRFERAVTAYRSGDAKSAIDQFSELAAAYPNGEFVADAHYFRGEAHVSEGNLTEAGKAFLEAFSHDRNGPVAPRALLRLGETLVDLERHSEACEILRNVGALYPNSGEAGLAGNRLSGMECG